ncbi:adenylate/guanylate cyclase domain-containing protein [Actinomadura rayongensis]|uniref:Guanylate cyclase domain-containing protein n=1 Tax=Actinomadura rayongensis TaxID=1429076 RepID=A0A6I4VWV2_9ACTN|nr:adenylate/guanylate cyclase domain-containing protein [Actinomadura rayongensis]MXQ62819.1 hypothetical protein [Actinomadura rayongensis]
MNRTIIGTDIVGFGHDRRRDAGTQAFLRDRMYGVLSDAFKITGLPWEDCRFEDRGDGVLIITPLDVDPAEAMDPLAHHLAALLRHANRLANPISRLRLRVAVHSGRVHEDPFGVHGDAVNHMARLLDAAAFKDAIEDAGADVGLLVSGALFGEATAASIMVNPAAYREIEVTNKETRTVAHLWLSA